MSTTNEATTAAPAAQDPVREKERVQLPPPVRDTDFKEKYPPDRELGHELDDTARVWKVYRGEAIDHDDALLKTWNETVNILLTFAGLFSAAVTSFVVASTDDLKPDPNAYVANLLFSMSNATASNASPFAHLPMPPPLEAAATPLARVVNGLWFTSLFLSLAAALLCILVKQWLDEYTARTRSSAKNPRQWAHRRSFYFQGLSDWNVAAIISFLPLFLHLALFLFLAGLTAFLWDLDSVIRWVLLLLMLLLLVFYVVLLFIPVWCAACPYATPLLAQLRNLGYTALIAVRAARNLFSKAMIGPLLCHIRDRRIRASLPTFTQNTGVPSSEGDSNIKLLLDKRARRPFERVLQKVQRMERDILRQEQGRFTDRLDCSALKWLMHDVSDSDAVAVAWQSLGALLEEESSSRFTCMCTTLTELVESAGGHCALWTALRIDGVLDDLQLGRMTRSALFVSFSMVDGVHQIIDYIVPLYDSACLENTLSPDAALIDACPYSGAPAPRFVQALHRLHEHGTHRPLPSTAQFFLYLLVPDANNSASQAAIGLLHHCNFRALSPSAMTHVTGVLGQRCTGSEANPSHQCGAYCVANALCARALQLIEEETSGNSNPRQYSGAPFDAYSHVQLTVRVLTAASSEGSVHLSSAVWTGLTDTRYSSRRIQQYDQIRAFNWAEALYHLAKSSNQFYASVATQYNSIWSSLLQGCIRDHPTVTLDDGIDFIEDLGYVLGRLDSALRYVTPWQTEITDPALRSVRIQSALTLAESASIAFCSMERRGGIRHLSMRGMACRISLLSILPTDLPMAEKEHNEWVELFVNTAQHLMALDPLPWNNLRDAVAASSDSNVNFFNEVHARLVDVGPCTKGECAGQGPADWLAALGPVL